MRVGGLDVKASSARYTCLVLLSVNCFPPQLMRSTPSGASVFVVVVVVEVDVTTTGPPVDVLLADMGASLEVGVDAVAGVDGSGIHSSGDGPKHVTQEASHSTSRTHRAACCTGPSGPYNPPLKSWFCITA